METTDFYPLTFSEIAEQDNPAFMPRALDRNENAINVPSLMIARQQDQKTMPDPGHNEQVIVFLIDDPANKFDRVTSLGKFWRLDIARQFCENFKI